MLGKASSDASAAAAGTQRSIQAIQAQIQQLNLQPTGADLQRQIRERVQGFIAADRHDVEERRRFNNWVMGLGVRLVVVDPKQLSIEPAIKATYDDAGNVTVAGAELVVRVP
jgi:hypothetical protein